MCALHDTTVRRLPVDLRQANGIEIFAVQQVAQYIPRADRRQLVCITDQNQTRARLQCIAQRLCQHQIHHRCLVDDNSLTLQRLQCIAPECHAARHFVVIIFEQPVDRTGVVPAGLHNALGSPPGRGSYRCFEAAPLQHRKQSPDDGCFPCAGTSGNDGHTTAQGDPHRFFLLRGKCDARFPLRFVQHGLCIGTNLDQPFGRICHRRQFTGDRAFCLVIAVNIDHALALYFCQLQAPFKHHILQYIADDRTAELQQCADPQTQFLQRCERMPFCKVSTHRKLDRRLHAVRTVRRHAESPRSLINLRKPQSREFLQQPERIVLCQRDRRIADQIVNLDDIVIRKAQTAKEQHLLRRYLTDFCNAVRLSSAVLPRALCSKRAA